ncbi:MAG: nitroreductase family protein [Alphaproteobacteria bacterium]|nr:nitroreductase family protein [Alphaproteobacteria bacterium]MCL2505691.1 nitroreductase family protein [Alphaproteobacteria bacterium]
MNTSFIEYIRKRRSQYHLGKTLPVSKAETENIIKEAVRLAPSPFNSQSSRVVILFGAQSQKLWDITKEALRKTVPVEKFKPTEDKINSFAAGIGTILFYEDMDIVKGMQEKFPLYKDKFPVWSEQSNGMAQFAVWSALAEANIGASLQHYNPLIDENVAKKWDIPAHWRLRAHMPFGSNEASLPPKTFIDDAVRFRTYA